MLIKCPNCNAQYEVPNDIIPAAGRDGRRETDINISKNEVGHNSVQLSSKLVFF